MASPTVVSSPVSSPVHEAPPEAHVKSTQGNFNAAVQQVKDIGSRLSKALTGGEHKTTMSRVADGLMAVAALGPAIANVGVRFAGKTIDKLVGKNPVLSMAAGVLGVVFGGLLCSVEPFSGVALLSASAYAIQKSYRPVHDRLMIALNKADQSKEDGVAVGVDSPEESSEEKKSA